MQLEARPAEAPAGGIADLGRGSRADRRLAATGFAASAAIHVVLLALFAWALSRAELPSPPPVQSMTVEVLSEEQFAALTPPKVPPEVRRPTPARPPAVPPPEKPLPLPPLTHAETILSGRALDREARASLIGLASDARFEQLCDVEAMEQIARHEAALRPVRTVAYATADTKVTGNIIVAEGAAFLSKGHWYRLSFRCETTPDHLKVVSFDYATGGLLPDGARLGTDGDD